MQCPDPQLLSALHDGELSDAVVAGLLAHVASCPACREELQAYRALSGAFDRMPSETLSDAGRARIVGMLRRRDWAGQVLSLARPFAAAAVVLLALGLPVLLAVSASSAGAGPGGAVAGGNEATTPVATAIVWEGVLSLRDLSPEVDPASSGQQAAHQQYADWVVADLSQKRP